MTINSVLAWSILITTITIVSCAKTNPDYDTDSECKFSVGDKVVFAADHDRRGIVFRVYNRCEYAVTFSTNNGLEHEYNVYEYFLEEYNEGDSK